LKKILNGGRPSFLTVVVSLLIVVGVTAVVLLIIQLSSDANTNAAPKSVPSNATLVTSGKAVPGQMLQVVGNHFTPGQTVFVTVDGQPLAYTSHPSALNLSMISRSSANRGGTPVKVRTDGTFTVAVPIDTHWTVGSTHHISVNNQQGKELKSLNFVVETNQAAGTAATGTIQIMNNDRQNPLSLPAGKVLTNTAGCTGQGLQISLNGAVDLSAYSGTGDHPTTTVPIQVVKPGAAGNIQDCEGSGGGYAFEYCDPSCDSAVSWTAFNINGGFTGGTDPQSPTAVRQSGSEKTRSFITVLLYKREYNIGYDVCPC
jgi:hypothetical protein